MVLKFFFCLRFCIQQSENSFRFFHTFFCSVKFFIFFSIVAHRIWNMCRSFSVRLFCYSHSLKGKKPNCHPEIWVICSWIVHCNIPFSSKKNGYNNMTFRFICGFFSGVKWKLKKKRSFKESFIWMGSHYSIFIGWNDWKCNSIDKSHVTVCNEH